VATVRQPCSPLDVGAWPAELSLRGMLDEAGSSDPAEQAVPAADGQIEALLDRLALVAASVLGAHSVGFRPAEADDRWDNRATPAGRVQGWQPRSRPSTGSSSQARPQARPQAQPRGSVSVLSLPLVVSDRVWGVFHLCRPVSQVWTVRDRVLVGMFADLAVSYIGVADQLDGAHRLADELEHRAAHDGLTGLPNRGVLFDRLEHAIVSAARTRTVVAVLFIDIDGFKEVNDSLGHAFGDLVLVQVARRIRSALRAGDTLARLGGDEFVAVCADLTGAPAQSNRWLRALGRRIQLQLHRPPVAGEVDVFLSVSIGVAVTMPAPCGQPRSAEDLIGEADRAMYAAKTGGGGRLVIGGGEVVPLVRRSPVRASLVPR
jgi:diguanylate cyclase (GGDEF)-like protein